MLGSMLIATLAAPPAHACGGFFCQRDPIDQAGEDIVFAVDDNTGTVTMHVQVAYTGTASEFAWIVPVSDIPELQLSTNRLFQELAWRTQPRFQLEVLEIEPCEGGYYWYGGYPEAALSSSSAPSDRDDGTVDVISEQRVGPYETVVLQAQSAEGLLDWLQTNEYLLPDSLDPVLAPYVADGSYFVALRLAKEADVGELSPLALTYEGTRASIPIQLTSIAATEDTEPNVLELMRRRAYVLGNDRAVPDSYLHVQVNDLVVDWFRGGFNWEDAITVAADEAGGQAFATDYSGSTDVMDDALFQEGRFDTDALAAESDPVRFFELLMSQGFVGDSTLLALFQQYLPMPQALADQGVREQDFYNCLECYAEHLAGIEFDSRAFAAAIDERIVAPLENAQGLFDSHPHLTRMTSSVSPVEMTVDPTFVFNADMAQSVDTQRTATVEMYCGDGVSFEDAPRRLVLADGRGYNLPSMRWFWDNGLTEYEYLSELYQNYALVIEDTSERGEPEVLFDGRDGARDLADAFNDASDVRIPGVGCGCQHGTPAGLALGLFGVLALGLRRRRS